MYLITFQSPSFRGGSTPSMQCFPPAVCCWWRFNPLPFRGGSTPGTGQINVSWNASVGAFQSPSFRGGSTPQLLQHVSGGHDGVSIPFVSGREHSRGLRKRQLARHNVSIPFVSGREHSVNHIRFGGVIALFRSPSFRGGSTPKSLRDLVCNGSQF